jgi:NAD(P)-dependent dehydrogenase (short-subunit alcohol dehydrogenase family)
MSKILITGCSSGFGLDTAKLFLERGWEVVATMRKPDDSLLPKSDRLQVLQLDVTDATSIAKAIADAGTIDVLVNNAGYAAPAPIELISLDQARALFETNTLGTLAVTQAMLPAFRERRQGVIINISSSTTLRPMPLLGIYRASKAAVNAFTESLALEMQSFGVRVHVVLPGRSPETRFGDNAFPHARGIDHPAYAPIFQQFIATVHESTGPVTYSSDVAEALWKIANDPGLPDDMNRRDS